MRRICEYVLERVPSFEATHFSSQATPL